MPNYSNGKIYSIRFYDNDKLIYIGSTTQTLAVRFGGHKRDMTCSLYQYIQDNYNGDLKCCYMELLEDYDCSDKNELNKKEGEIIRKYKADTSYTVINKYIAGRDNKQYRQENADRIKEYKKQYREDNSDKIKEFQRQYRKENTDKIKEKDKQFREENADKIKQYRQENGDKIKEQIKQYKQENTDKIKEYNRQYYLKKKSKTETE